MRIDLAVHPRPPQKLGQLGLTVKSVIAVGSGKGGVGKSTIATCLAIGLRRAGAVVGLMDADVYGPSIPHLLGVSGRPEVNEGRIRPVEAAGLRVMSMGFSRPARRSGDLGCGAHAARRDHAIPPRHDLGRVGLFDYRHAARHGGSSR